MCWSHGSSASSWVRSWWPFLAYLKPVTLTPLLNFCHGLSSHTALGRTLSCRNISSPYTVCSEHNSLLPSQATCEHLHIFSLFHLPFAFRLASLMNGQTKSTNECSLCHTHILLKKLLHLSASQLL